MGQTTALQGQTPGPWQLSSAPTASKSQQYFSTHPLPYLPHTALETATLLPLVCFSTFPPVFTAVYLQQLSPLINPRRQGLANCVPQAQGDPLLFKS